MSEWIECKSIMGVLMNAETGFLHEDLRHTQGDLLVTYITKIGRRYVEKCSHSKGFLLKKMKGKVIAFMPLPEPYKGEINYD